MCSRQVAGYVWGWNASVCIVWHVDAKQVFSLMITSKQVKAEDPRLRNLLYVYVVVSRAVCKKVFSSHSEVFSLEVVWAHHL